MGKIANCKDFLMLLLYARGHTGRICEPIVGKTRLMKMVFLFEKEIRQKFNLEKIFPKDILPEFEAHNFGPFSAQVYSDLEFLVEMGFVEVTSTDDTELLEDEIREYEYWRATTGLEEEEEVQFPEKFSLTELGVKFIKAGHAGVLSNEQIAVLDEFKRKCTGIDLLSLLKYVYTKYPDTTEKSKIRGKVTGK